MVKNISPNCAHCNDLETINHVFIECPFHAMARNSWKKELEKEGLADKSITELLRLAGKSNLARKLIIYIRDIGYMDKI